ncbi:MAG TPA: DUF86 domain-containing protein [Polyangia bacterium]|jgi:uncharacterized protein YutE (UPF0331/DUF86 family)
MVERHLVEQKLAAIHDRLARIRSKLPPTKTAFLADQDAQESVAFNLFLAFQDALDVAGHLIGDAGWPMPATAREHFAVLAQKQVLTAGTAAAMAGCAGLRNLIAHSYGTLDLGRVYDELPAGEVALRAFCAEVASAT